MNRPHWQLMMIVLVGGLLLAGLPSQPTSTAQSGKPFILPVQSAPGPDSWLMGQYYGNTTGAYNFGAQWYSAGQRLHFGLDLWMRCGTPLVAMADGEVHAVDARAFGSAPHNLILVHRDLNLSVLYGHLLETPTLVPGQPVQQGEVIGLSGDPDDQCDSRPHLHLEVRSLDFSTTFNPVDYIDAPWHKLANIGPFSDPMFQQDMDNPRRWMSVDDQPNVLFGYGALNDYASTWPYPIDVRPPDNAVLDRQLEPLPESVTVTARSRGIGACCPHPWWHPTDTNRFYLIDGVAGIRASVFEYTVDNSVPPTPIEEAPPMLVSPDRTLQVTRVNGQITIRRLDDLTEWPVQTQGALPAVNPDNTQLLWEVWRGQYLPGEPYQTVETWVSDIDGNNPRMIWQQSGGWAVWLDSEHILIVSPVLDRTDTTLTVYNTLTGQSYPLGIFNWMRDISVAPGGGRIMFFLVNQLNANDNGVYVIDVEQGAQAEQLPFFGGWQWRDANSVFYIPLDLSTESDILAYYHLETGENRYLTDPTQLNFQVANGDWAVAADGNTILFRDARDLNVWLLELTN